MLPAIAIRRATPTDAAALAGLLRELGYPAEPAPVAAILRALLDDPRMFVFVAEDADGTVGGLLTLSSRPVLRLQGTVGVIEELAVREGARGRGIGGRLVQYAKGLATERGWVRLETSVARARESHRRGFFAAHGFAPMDSIGYRWGLLESCHPVLPAFRPARRRELV